MAEFRPRIIGRYSRLFLLILSEINLLLGALFFVDPSQSIGFWPWPVKELAARFLGAIFLAIAFGCWSVLRANGWQRGKILPVVGGLFYGITAVIMALQIPGGSNLTITLSWVSFLTASTIGLLLVIKKHGWHRRHQDNISHGPRVRVASLFFLIQTLVVGIFGVLMLFLPDLALHQFWPWHVGIPTIQTFAALFLATCGATGWAIRQADKGRILALLPLDAAFPALALLAVGVHWNVVAAESPSGLVTSVWVFLYSFVSAGSLYIFLSLRRSAKGHDRE
jgi:hypothetical protein